MAKNVKPRKHPNRSAIPSNVAKGMVVTRVNAGPMRDRRERRPKDAKNDPIVKECEECMGTGSVEATCDCCGVALTLANVEPGTDDLCVECAAEDEL